MNKFLKAVAVAATVALLSATTGCAAVPGQPLTQNQQNNEQSPFNPGMGNWGWNDNNQNGG
ncbi:hypothetical protein D3C77_637450 [compost metagenome]